MDSFKLNEDNPIIQKKKNNLVKQMVNFLFWRNKKRSDFAKVLQIGGEKGVIANCSISDKAVEFVLKFAKFLSLCVESLC